MIISTGTNLKKPSKNVVRTAFNKGSEDNLTAVVVQFGMNDANAERIIRAAKGGGAGIGGGEAIGFASERGGRGGGGGDDFDMFG